MKSVSSDSHQAPHQHPGETDRVSPEQLLQQLREDASTQPLEEVLERAGSRTGGNIGLDQAVAAVRAERNSR